jgi:hypothetical protein
MTAKAEPKTFAIASNLRSMAEVKRNVHFCIAPHGSTPADLEKPEACMHIARTLTQFDRLEVVWPHGKHWAEYLCTFASPTMGKLQLLCVVELPGFNETVAGRIPKGYSVRRANPGESDCGSAFLVVRDSDDFTMSLGQRFTTEEQAVRWISDHAIFRTTEGYPQPTVAA